MSRSRCERGTGLLGTLFGVGAVVVTLGFAANVCVGLWTRSTVESVAQDAARDVAATPGGDVDRTRVEEILNRARARLGRTGARIRLQIEVDTDSVVVRVRHPGVSLLPRMLGHLPAVGAVDERLVVRREGVS